jgi:hypothetical protein
MSPETSETLNHSMQLTAESRSHKLSSHRENLRKKALFDIVMWNGHKGSDCTVRPRFIDPSYRCHSVRLQTALADNYMLARRAASCTFYLLTLFHYTHWFFDVWRWNDDLTTMLDSPARTGGWYFKRGRGGMPGNIKSLLHYGRQYSENYSPPTIQWSLSRSAMAAGKQHCPIATSAQANCQLYCLWALFHSHMVPGCNAQSHDCSWNGNIPRPKVTDCYITCSWVQGSLKRDSTVSTRRRNSLHDASQLQPLETRSNIWDQQWQIKGAFTNQLRAD